MWILGMFFRDGYRLVEVKHRSQSENIVSTITQKDDIFVEHRIHPIQIGHLKVTLGQLKTV